jgi:hypothetical protein
MIVPFTVAVRPDYATAEMAARRLAREELVETVPYLVEPGHQFRPCQYCGEPRWPAVLAWSWRRWSGSSAGLRASCAYWPCVRAVLKEAELDRPLDGITCAYPVLGNPDAGAALAA